MEQQQILISIENLIKQLSQHQYKNQFLGVGMLEMFVWGFVSGSQFLQQQQQLYFNNNKNNINTILKQNYEEILNFSELKQNQIISEEQSAFIINQILQNPQQNLQKLIQVQLEGIFSDQPLDMKRQTSEENYQKSKKLIEELSKQEEQEYRKLQEQKKKEQELSEKLIKDIEQEEEKKIEEKFQVSEQQVTCPICMDSLINSQEKNKVQNNIEQQQQQPFPLTNCVHCYHTSCLSNYIEAEINGRKFPIICPDVKCKIELDINDIEDNIDDELAEKYLKYTFSQYVDSHADEMSYCPTPNCGYVFMFQDENEFICPLCRKDYCLHCRVEFHKGETCKEYQINNQFSSDDQKFLAFVRGQKFKQCSRCKFWVEKNEGCNHMTCRCGYEFCYICGGVYQQCDCYNNNQNNNVVINRPVVIPQRVNVKRNKQEIKGRKIQNQLEYLVQKGGGKKKKNKK